MLLQKAPTVRDREDARQFVLTKGEVDFKKVKFSYDGQRQVTNDLTLHVKAGQTIALVGETGGGKSTILKLLFRFYDVTGGQILIDGQDVRDVTLESLRQNIGVVPQDPSLFDQTILENLRYAKEEEKGDKAFAEKLSELGDVYVNDAFGTAHRAHASTAVIAQFFPADKKMFGLLMESEMESAERILHNSEKPFLAIIGGAKVSDKILIIENFVSFTIAIYYSKVF